MFSWCRRAGCGTCCVTGNRSIVCIRLVDALVLVLVVAVVLTGVCCSRHVVFVLVLVIVEVGVVVVVVVGVGLVVLVVVVHCWFCVVVVASLWLSCSWYL